jgi:hypothetical protein
MSGNMEKRIEEKLKSRKWSFMELLKMHELANELAKELNEELPLDERVALVWQHEISADNEYLGSIVERTVIEILTNLFIKHLQEMAENATVSFEKNAPLPPKTPPIEKPAPPKTPVVLEKRKVKTQSDGTKLPEGVERV